jgi:DNA-binding NarL/FixJ family response regulator
VIRVLLADDHEAVREGLRALLNGQPDMEVAGEASNGREAVRQARLLRPHVVVMDMAMPILAGVGATVRIRSACPGTRILMLSMHSTPEHVFRALHAGASGYVLKGSAGSEVADAIRRVHSGARYLSEKIAAPAVDKYIAEHPRLR